MNHQQLQELLATTEEKRTLTNQTYNRTYYNDNFQALLQIGNYFERLSADRIIKHYCFVNPKIVFNNTYKYDIKINNKRIKVKADMKSIRTGNIFIEYTSLGKASGISITQAKYYCIVIPYSPNNGEFILIRVKKLKQLIEKQLFFKHFQPNNNNNNITGGYVFRKKLLISNGKLI